MEEDSWDQNGGTGVGGRGGRCDPGGQKKGLERFGVIRGGRGEEKGVRAGKYPGWGAQGISRRRAEALSTAAAPRGQRRAARNPPTPEHPLGEAEAALGAPGLPGGAAAALNPARLPHGDRRRRRLGAQGDDDTARAGAGR